MRRQPSAAAPEPISRGATSSSSDSESANSGKSFERHAPVSAFAISWPCLLVVLIIGKAGSRLTLCNLIHPGEQGINYSGCVASNSLEYLGLLSHVAQS